MFGSVPFLSEAEKAAPRGLRTVFRVPHGHRPAAGRAARLVQSPGVHGALAVVLHGHQRGVQSVAGQFHDGTRARCRVHPDGRDTGLEADHDGHAAVDAHNERDDGHHAHIADVHEAAPAAAAHQLRADHRPAGGEARHRPVRGQTVHVLLFHTPGQAHQGQDTHTVSARLSVAHPHHAVHVQRWLVSRRTRQRRAQHAFRDRHRRPLDHALGLQQGATAGENPRPGTEAGPAQRTVPVPVFQLCRCVRRARRRDLLVRETAPAAVIVERPAADASGPISDGGH
ncbi:hypothetical protein AGLY_012582 [Aphis glycines]|uniref:Uncharacterized protein n=1 Tax=Aphis glycines TaxID=307491 RepID=A0A6G0T8X2_APHGL|nr:hypothetical protein AGLY_012582 [Aphis glycines]